MLASPLPRALAPMPESKQVLVERIFGEHLSALRAVLFRRVRTEPQAADLAQEVYVRMLQIKDIGAIRDPEGYLFTVARNLAHQYAFLQRRAQFTVDVEEPSVQVELAEVPTFGTQIDTAKRTKKLRDVLRKLPAKQRAAVEMAYWHGLSYEEIAQRLDVSTHMVKKYLSQTLVICRLRMARLR
jgi:RNA polymerase sigma factor (sigma-70 family)